MVHIAFISIRSLYNNENTHERTMTGVDRVPTKIIYTMMVLLHLWWFTLGYNSTTINQLTLLSLGGHAKQVFKFGPLLSGPPKTGPKNFFLILDNY